MKAPYLAIRQGTSWADWYKTTLRKPSESLTKNPHLNDDNGEDYIAAMYRRATSRSER